MYPDAEFPRFTTSSAREIRRLRKALADRIGLSSAATGEDILTKLRRLAHPLLDVSVDHPELDLRAALASIGVAPLPSVYVNWDRLETVDRLSATSLSRHFDDIWYPSADDIEIFDRSLSWVISVSHFSAVDVADLRSVGGDRETTPAHEVKSAS